MFIVTPIVGVCNCSMFCCTLLYVHSSIAIILMGKRELVALLNVSYWCLVMVERLFLAVSWGCLRFVIVVFPDHTHLLLCKWHRCVAFDAKRNKLLQQVYRKVEISYGLFHRGSYMSAHVLLNLIYELGKSDKMRGLPSILSIFRNEFNKFNNTTARMLDST